GERGCSASRMRGAGSRLLLTSTSFILLSRHHARPCAPRARVPEAGRRELDNFEPKSVNVFFAFGTACSYQWRLHTRGRKALLSCPNPVPPPRRRSPNYEPRSTGSTPTCIGC